MTDRPDPAYDPNRIEWIDSRGLPLELRKYSNPRARAYCDIIGNQTHFEIKDLPGPYALTFNLDVNPATNKEGVMLAVHSRSDPSAPARTAHLPEDFYDLLCKRRLERDGKPVLLTTAEDDNGIKALNGALVSTIQSGIAAVDTALKSMGSLTPNDGISEIAHPLFEFMVEAYSERMKLEKHHSIHGVSSTNYPDARHQSGYADGLLETTASVTINGSYGPYTLDIAPEWETIRLTFTNTQGEPIAINLSNDTWVPRIIDRLKLIKKYDAAMDALMQNSDPLKKDALQATMDKADAVRRKGHDTLAATLSSELATHTPPITIDFTTARNLIGTITDIVKRPLMADVERELEEEAQTAASDGQPQIGQWEGKIPPRANGQRQL